VLAQRFSKFVPLTRSDRLACEEQRIRHEAVPVPVSN